MAKLLKLRRGTTTQHASFTGAEGEVTIDTDKDTAVVHDGSTQAGRPLAREDMTNVSSANIAARLGADSIATTKIAGGALPTDVTVASANIVNGTIVSADIADGTIENADVNASAGIAGTKINPSFGSQTISTSGNLVAANGTFQGGILTLGTADTSSGHVNAKEAMTFNIDSDNDDTNRSFKWYKDGSSGSGTQLLALDENGTLTASGNVDANSGIDVTGNMTVTGTVDGRDVAADGSKLDGIEIGATADQSAAEILTAIKTVDGSGSGLDADTLDGVSSASFIRSDAADTATHRITFSGNETNNYDTMATGSGSQGSIEVYNSGSGNDAFMAFHAGSDFALYFGLDADTNDIAVGGWSMGAAKYRVWHAGNDGSGSGLDADLWDGQQFNAYLNQAVLTTSNPTFNQIYANDWFRVNGTDGIYWETYGGGWNMTDTTWMRCYNGKALYVANQIAATGNVTAYYSDERLKKRTGTINDALSKVCQIETFYYKENDLAKSFGYNNGETQVGVSAQSVEKVMPEVVHLAPFDYETAEDGTISSKSGEDYKTVDYARLVPLLIESIKELKSEIDELKGGK